MKLLKFNHSEQVSLSEEKDMVCIFEEEDYYDDEVLLSLVDMSLIDNFTYDHKQWDIVRFDGSLMIWRIVIMYVFLFFCFQDTN